MQYGVVIPDTHVPAHDKKAWGCALGIISDVKPAFGVIIGDFADLEALSSHPRSRPEIVKLQEEYYACNIALDELQNASPNTSWVYIEGNHEVRAIRYMNAMGSLDGLLSVPEQLYLEKPPDDAYHRKAGIEPRGIRWIPTAAQPYVTAHSAYAHGHQCRSERIQHHAAWFCNNYVSSFCHGKQLFYGHYHTFQFFKGISRNRAQCSGYLGGSMSYVSGVPIAWEHGLIVQEVAPDGQMAYTPVKIQDGLAIFQGKIIRAPSED